MTTAHYPVSATDNEKDLDCLANYDERHFARLYDRFSGALFGVILSRIGDMEVAENLLQDVFVKAWRYRKLYDASKGRVFTWLYNITRSTCIDHLRSKAHKQCRASVLSDDLSLLLPGAPADYFIADSIGLRKMVGHLRREEKEVVELMYFEGFTQREIADRMNIPLGTVKTRVRRAIKNLRAIFTDDWKAASSISLN